MTRSPLLALRLQQHQAPPPTPTNADSIRAYRALAPVWPSAWAIQCGRQVLRGDRQEAEDE